jgi:hypothetical protein
MTAPAIGEQAVQPRVWWWPDLTVDEARNAWKTLTEWMQDVLVVRYPEVDNVLQPCWYRHPAAVDALTSLYTTWLAAYQDLTAQPTAAASWLNQWLPAAIEQIKQALRSCDWTAHRDDTARRQNSGRLFCDGLAGFIAADVAARSDKLATNSRLRRRESAVSASPPRRVAWSAVDADQPRA